MKETTYKQIQIESEDEMVTGEILLHEDDTFVNAELFTTTFNCVEDIQEAREFLDTVEKMVGGITRDQRYQEIIDSLDKDKK